MNLFGRTDIGSVRSSNQDAYLSGYLPNGAVWIAVCDGMGGANGGNIASALAINAISSAFEKCGAEKIPEDEIASQLEKMLAEANEAIYNKAQQEPDLLGMGTTAVLAYLFEGHITIAHVGDSRAYLFHNGAVRRLTEDHSIVQELVRLGELTEEQARRHPRRNIITRAVGVAPVVEADVTRAEMEPQDVLLICTDGLSGYLSDEELGEFLKEYSGQDLIDHLVDFALESGGADNITVATAEND